MAIDRTGITSLDTGASDITYTGVQGPKSPDQMLMASADPMLVEEYNKYVFDIDEQGQTPISFKEFVQQIMSGMADGGRAGQAYGGTANPTYTQSRKQRINAAGGGIMGSNAGSMLVAPTADGSRPGYGWLSKIKDKFVDDIIPNEIKENPMLSAAVLGAGVNQFGLPDWLVPDFISEGSNVGQNWIGNLLGGIPGIPSDTVIGNTAAEKARMKGIGAAKVLGRMVPGAQHGDVPGEGIQQKYADILNTLREPNLIQQGANWVKDQFGNVVDKFTGQQVSLDGDGSGTQQGVAWKRPLAIGAAMGAAQAAMPKAQLPQDTSGIDMASAIRGDELRFKPDASVLAAQGGRIGYEHGGRHLFSPSTWLSGGPKSETNPTLFGTQDSLLNKASIGQLKNAIRGYEAQKVMGELDEEQQTDYDLKIKQLEALEQGAQGQAQGGRIRAQEGGLMDLGGMEKDYRQEGGFVPIGGEEKADDVPARLSRNQFVFTADAVRAAGGGDIDAGAEVMENVMNNLEQGGQISEESQGLEGARDMFATAQRLEGVL